MGRAMVIEQKIGFHKSFRIFLILRFKSDNVRIEFNT